MRLLLAAFAACSFVLAGCGDAEEPAVTTPTPGPAEGPPGSLNPPRLASRQASRRVPPISGGTLLVLRDDATAAVSDPDHDVVWLVDLSGRRAPRRAVLRLGDEPGRLAQDAAGLVHVALRGVGAVATVDPARATVTARRAVCPAPRGVAWNPALSALHVVCAGGEFVTLPLGGAAPIASQLDDDLRDVIVHEGAVYVSRLRAATVLRVELRDGRVASASVYGAAAQATAAVAWRMASSPGGIVVLSQATLSPMLGFSRAPVGYYGEVAMGTGPIAQRIRVVASAPDQSVDAILPDAGFTVDVAAFTDGAQWRAAIASPGWAFRQGWPQVREWTMSPWSGQRVLQGVAGGDGGRAFQIPGQAVAVAYTRAGSLLVQTRAPGRIVTPQHTITLYDDNVGDVGHDLFHAATLSGLACASCHPEGGDDGLTWDFVTSGVRRTPSLRGGILQTAPFHWRGDLPGIRDLCDTVFTARMGGGPVAPAHAEAMGRWLDGLLVPPRAPPVDVAAVARGAALFRAPDVGCATCHAGARYTDNRTVDVGTGGPFQTPPLVEVARRAPYMHDGCALTLMARFTDARCGGGEQHGHTAQLSAAQRDDLIAYLQTL